MSLSSQQVEEVKFWRNLVRAEGAEGFIRRRRGDFYRHMHNFNGWADLSGLGLEVGTGCFSQLEWANSDMIYGVDPLADEYRTIEPQKNKNVELMTYDGENLKRWENDNFDWVVCWNVIDHTPNPQAMADEIYRVIYPGGKFYFEVNFDDQLSPCHYGLWNEEIVNKTLSKFTKLYSQVIRNDADSQSLYYGVYQK